jgi:hypothetical protein
MVILFLLGSSLLQDNGNSVFVRELPLSWKSLLPNKNRITIVLEETTT